MYLRGVQACGDGDPPDGGGRRRPGGGGLLHLRPPYGRQPQLPQASFPRMFWVDIELTAPPRDDFEVSCPELDTLVEAALEVRLLQS